LQNWIVILHAGGRRKDLYKGYNLSQKDPLVCQPKPGAVIAGNDKIWDFETLL